MYAALHTTPTTTTTTVARKTFSAQSDRHRRPSRHAAIKMNHATPLRTSLCFLVKGNK
jgi:hypothetical protein